MQICDPYSECHVKDCLPGDQRTGVDILGPAGEPCQHAFNVLGCYGQHHFQLEFKSVSDTPYNARMLENDCVIRLDAVCAMSKDHFGGPLLVCWSQTFQDLG